MFTITYYFKESASGAFHLFKCCTFNIESASENKTLLSAISSLLISLLGCNLQMIAKINSFIDDLN